MTFSLKIIAYIFLQAAKLSANHVSRCLILVRHDTGNPSSIKMRGVIIFLLLLITRTFSKNVTNTADIYYYMTTEFDYAKRDSNFFDIFATKII